jgi:hypothetical protein
LIGEQPVHLLGDRRGLVAQLTPGDPDHAPALGLQLAVARALRFEGVARGVGVVARSTARSS